MVIGGEYPDLQPVFEVTAAGSWDQIPESPTSYQLIVVCSRLDSQDSVSAIARVLDPVDGVVVLLAPPDAAGTRRYRPLAIQTRSTRKLLRDSGLKAHAVYGALPDPRVPEYVFPLTRAASAFAIERFLLSRRPAWGWIRVALRIGVLVRLATSGLPGGLILCRLGGDRR